MISPCVKFWAAARSAESAVRQIRLPPAQPCQLTLERLEERDDLIPLRRAERLEHGGHDLSLPAVAQDRLGERQRGAVVHVPVVLDDAVAGADVMQEEVAVRMDDLVAERGTYRQRSSVDDCPDRRRRDR